MAGPLEDDGAAGGSERGGEDSHVAEARVEVEGKEGTHEDADHSVEAKVRSGEPHYDSSVRLV